MPFAENVQLRPTRPEDAEACAGIHYRAFKTITERHGVASSAGPEHSLAEIHGRMGNPAIYGIVAEAAGRILGFNFLLESDPIRGVGPICVDPDVQAGGIGRRLMEDVLVRARGAAGVRLVQAAYNTTSMSLYASLGFDVKEPLVIVRGTPRGQPPPDVEVRPMTPDDLDACSALYRGAHGIDRRGELHDALGRLGPLVAIREGRIAGYVAGRALGHGTHGVAEREDDLRALVLAAGALNSEPVRLLVPTRQASFFRWCLRADLRVTAPMTLMAMGDYQEPRGAYFPSILY